MNLFFKPLLYLFLFLSFFFVACSNSEEATPEITETPTMISANEDTIMSEPDVEVEVTASPIAEATSTPRPTSQPTPVLPYIDGADQPLTDDGNIIIPRAVSPQDGWLVIYQEGDGELGAVLGYTAVSEGINEDLTLSIDPMEATETVIALLHVDQAPIGEFDFPDGEDVPVEYETAVIAAPIQLDFQISQPDITVSTQEVGEDGMLLIDSVLSPIAGWLVIHADDQGELGTILGSTLIDAGLNEEISIHIPWREGTPTLYAAIYEDNGREQRVDIPGEDVPLNINDNPVIEAFSATYPPDIYVLDQPIVDGTFVVERVISNGPGYLVAYYDNEGEPGLIIGSQAIEDGLNEYVRVEILETAVTPLLHLRLHEDSEPGDDFDFPRVDQPIRYDDRLPPAVPFNNEPGNYLITADQYLGTEAAIINVPYVVVELPAWLVIHADDDGQRGEIIGVTSLEIGLNRNVEVEVTPEDLTETLYAVLYLDAEEIGEFEYPDGDDVPLQRSRRVLQVPFQILQEEE